MTPATPVSTHIVLVGGGHSHVGVVKSFGMKPEPGVVVTLIAKELDAPYSGMLPGLVAGHYSYDQCHIDLVRLANWAGARLIHGSAIGIDRTAKRVMIEGRPPLGYDLLSIDVGITPKLEGIPGASEHGIAVKPVSSFYRRWRALEEAALRPGGPRQIVLIGAGAAGFELVLAIKHRFETRGQAGGIPAGAFSFTLIGSGGLLPTHNAGARLRARKALAAQGVTLVEHDRVVAIEADRVKLDSGGRLACDAVLLSTEAGPPGWFGDTDLPKDERGFLAVRPTLQVLDDDDIFAVGDCATVMEHRREKAGVFAVRQGPPLTDNLRRRVRGLSVRPFVPQKGFLTLLSTGGRHAIAARNGLAIAGGWVWRWKDHIDRTFMDRFNVLPQMNGAGEDAGMRCAGCAAKIGPVSLSRALDRIEPQGRIRDDVAVIAESATRLRLETIDFFRAFWPEPYLLGQIAAVHAMNDVLAKGGRPTHALANAVLPHAAATRTEEDLFQLLSGAKAAFASEGVELIGGHSSEGLEMAAGFFVSGQVEPERLIPKRGARAGDMLILTRPLGTGILLAGLMRGRARGGDIAGALEQMRAPAGRVAQAAAGFSPSAGTDVSGFGFAGHLLEMLGEDASAQIDLSATPLYPGVLALARDGIASTLLPENMRLGSALNDRALRDPATAAVLFDAQTAGGFLYAVAQDKADACVAALKAAGAPAATIVGRIGPATGRGKQKRIELEGALNG